MIMTAPAILLMRFICSFKNCPTAVAEAPSAMKTTEKPRTKNNALRSTRFRTAERLPELCISSNEMPEMNERYPGTIGRTQGEINDRIPKRNAVSMVTFVSTISPSRNVINYDVIIRIICIPRFSR
jgi:hypothetical protein